MNALANIRKDDWWQSEDLENYNELHFNEKRTSSLCVSPDGKIIVSGSVDYDDVYFWDIQTRELIDKIKMKPNHADNYVFLDDKNIILGTQADPEIALWIFNINTGVQSGKLSGIEGAPVQILKTNDGKILACGWSNEVSCWDIKHQNFWKIGLKSRKPADRIYSIAYTNGVVVTGDYWGNIIAYDVHTKERQFLKKSNGHSCTVYALESTSDGKIISADYNGVFSVFDLKTSRQIKEMKIAGNNNFISDFIITPGNKVIAINQRNGCHLDLLDIEAGFHLRRIEVGAWVRSIVLTDEGEIIVAGDAPLIRIFKIIENREKLTEHKKILEV